MIYPGPLLATLRTVDRVFRRVRAALWGRGAEQSHARAGEARRGLSQSERRELARFEATSVRTPVVFSFPRF